ncbi:MAG: DUF4062 domain-containing protein [Candidatus Eisenbacteria bacterium]|nr:DUF4062 domain-containing protein [Candidatus Eisenbacteria bacterium]
MKVSEMLKVVKDKADKTRCRPLNVFVSSTFVDLKPERLAVREAILRCGCLPRLAEEADMQPRKTVLQQIPYWFRDIHVLVLLVATRYGELAPSEVSWTEQEVRRAAKIRGVFILPYFLSPNLPAGIEFNKNRQNRLKKFKEYLMNLPSCGPALAQPPQYPNSTVDLQLRVARDVGACQSDLRIMEVLKEMLAVWKTELESEEKRGREAHDGSFVA